MQVSSELNQKLEAFVRKYHLNDILRGAILFVSIGLLYLLLLLLVEYFFWLPSGGRKSLFWSFIIVEVILLYRWILVPLSKLLKLQQGITYEQSAKIIGDHFPEVSDKLLNTLQLQQNEEPSELLIASVEQKMEEMKAFSFPKAVSYSSNKKYVPYFALPILVFAISFLIADANWFGSSYKRVANYNIAYTPPVPYRFHLLNDSLSVVQNQSFDLVFTIVGNRIPEEVKLLVEEEVQYLQTDNNGIYHYTLVSGFEDLTFSIIGNNKVRQDFVLKVLPKPFIENMELHVQPPLHTKLSAFTVRGSGTSEVPEGSKVTWNIEAKQSDELRIVKQDSIYEFQLENELFIYNEQVLQAFDYHLVAVNKQSGQKEEMHFRMQVIKDAYPTIHIQQFQDAVEPTLYEFTGFTEDDYGLRSLDFVIYPSINPSKKVSFDIPISGDSFEEFQFKFDTRKYIQEKGSYVYYFEVADNDVVNGYKTTRSDMGTIIALSSEDVKDSQLDFQKDKLQDLSENIKKWMEENSDLQELESLERTSEEVRWEDVQKVNSFTKQEQLAMESLEKIAKDLKQNLEKMTTDPASKTEKEELQMRMEEQLQDMKKNQELLNKLEEYQSKISNEELLKEIEDYTQQKKIQEKNLGQLLELTKRFYVSEKNNKLASDLMELGYKQENLAKREGEGVNKEQEKLQEHFDLFREELEGLMIENQQLLKPFSLHQDKSAEERISEEQQEALDKMDEAFPNDRKPAQQSAGQKMKELGQAMQQQQMQVGMDSVAEDASVLRQILDNLVRFSFSQEELLEVFSKISFTNPKYGNYLTSQHDLKQNYKHVNDSLFSLSLRQPSMGKQIHQLTTEINDHIDVSLEDLAQNRIPNGITQQQYTLTGANELAVILSDILENMQMQMESSGSGQGEGQVSEFQLSDIIEEQQSLMGDGQGEETSQESEGNGSEGGSGEASSEGKDGTKGEDGGYYEIYKQQQQLKMQLEDYLLQHGIDGTEFRSILKEMDAVSLKLLEQGNTETSRRQMQQILHKLLELESATLQQEEYEQRKANANFNQFPGSTNSLQLTPREEFPATEVLNRESLHLTPYYRRKIHEFFN